jgi:hypothetical protein
MVSELVRAPTAAKLLGLSRWQFLRLAEREGLARIGGGYSYFRLSDIERLAGRPAAELVEARLGYATDP